MTIYEKLSNVQQELKVPKSQYNTFGKYNYRSAEDIIEGVKKVAGKYKALVVLTDTLENIGDRFYIKAEAKFIDIESDTIISTTAYAREDEFKKGMDGSQVTGTASSYARKYALNGLFAIDDNKDSDEIEVNEIEDDQLSKIIDAINSINNKKFEQKVLDEYGVKNFEELTFEQASECIKRLEKTIENRG